MHQDENTIPPPVWPKPGHRHFNCPGCHKQEFASERCSRQHGCILPPVTFCDSCFGRIIKSDRTTV